MRTSMKWVIVIGEVLLFGLAVCALSEAADYSYCETTHISGVLSAQRSPYASSRVARSASENFRAAAVLVPRNGGAVGAVQISPARLSDLPPSNDSAAVNYPELTSLGNTRSYGEPLAGTYQQVNYRTAAAPRTVVAAGYTTPVTAVQYPPATTYAAPNYNAPVVGVPHAVYSPVTPAPIVRQDVQVGTGIYGQPVIYRPGQPLRNAWRWLTP